MPEHYSPANNPEIAATPLSGDPSAEPTPIHQEVVDHFAGFEADVAKDTENIANAIGDKDLLEKVGILRRSLIANDSKRDQTPQPDSADKVRVADTYYQDPTNVRQEALLNVYFKTLENADPHLVLALFHRALQDTIVEHQESGQGIKEIAHKNGLSRQPETRDIAGQQAWALEAVLQRFAQTDATKGEISLDYIEAWKASIIGGFTGQKMHPENYHLQPGTVINPDQYDTLLLQGSN